MKNKLLHVGHRDATTNYNVKLLMCSNGYVEAKKYARTITRIQNGFELEKKQLHRTSTIKKNTSGMISKSNLSRTRNTLIGYACENEELFFSFITLTFSDNKKHKLSTDIDITDIGQANKKFNNWCKQIRRIYPDFAYLCVPEYQKRGAIHYHLLTNLRCGVEIPRLKPKKTYNTEKQKYYELEYYNIPYWSYGFSTAYDINKTDDKFNIALYITKYLYKDVDNRLFGHKKILKSNNLRKPTEFFCNSPTYEQAIKFIKEKGYLIKQYEFQPTEQYQIPFEKSSTKLSQLDYNILRDKIT